MIREAPDRLSSPERLPDAWWIHSRIVDIFNETCTFKKENIEKIAALMKSFTELDLMQKVLILENTVGRRNNDGILKTAYQYGVIAQLGEAVDLIIDSCYSDNDIDGKFWERFCDVKNNYRTKYENLLKEKGNKSEYTDFRLHPCRCRAGKDPLRQGT